jgi:hypothetical protein
MRPRADAVTGQPIGATILSMKTGDLLAAMFVLATTSVAAQIATGIHLVDVRFSGDTRLEAVDLKKCAADLKSRTSQNSLGF